MGRSQVSSFPAAVRREMMKSKAVNSDPVTAGVMEVKDDITAGITESLGVGSSMANRREYFIFLAASIWFVWESSQC
jgi:hypothetical protein